MGALQEFPQKESMIPFCKWCYTIDLPEKAPWVMRRAFNIARSPPPGPVFVEVPIDVGQTEFDLKEEYKPAPFAKCAGEPGAIREASELLMQADSPVIVAGRGIHQSTAWKELQDLAELLAIPITTTNSGKSAISEDHPLYTGGIGINMTKVSEKIYNEADVVFFIGTQLEEWATGLWHWFPSGAKIVYSDADPTQMSRNWVPDVAIVGDAKLVLQQIINYCSKKVQKRSLEQYPRVKSLIKLKEEYRKEIEDLSKIDSIPIHPVRLVLTLNKLMDKDAIAILGEGQNRVWTATYLQIKRAGHWISASDYGCMGLSVPAAIGVKLGKPNNQVFCVTGDGSFQMQMHELPVAQQYNAPVVWFVADDGALGWIK